MKKNRTTFLFLMASLLCCFSKRSFATTPMDTPIKEGSLTEIECEYTLNEKILYSKLDIAPDKGIYHYSVFVPTGYSTNPEKRYPCLFICSPSGNAPLGAVKDYVTKNQWIAVMLKESKNGPGGPCYGNFLAAHDDVVARLRIEEGSKVVTGLSGGARVASQIAGARPGFVGLILQCAGFSQHANGKYNINSLKLNKAIKVYGLFGETDMNLKESGWLENQLPNYTKLKIEKFKGGHEWAPADSMERALDWVLAEVNAQKQASKPKITTVPLDTTRPLRTWTATMGATFEASLLRTDISFAYLKAADDTERKVPISALIPADRTYISSLIPQ